VGLLQARKATLDEKISINSGFCTVPRLLFVCLLALTNGRNYDERAIILGCKLLELLCSKLPEGCEQI
jgi:hypothetical protein